MNVDLCYKFEFKVHRVYKVGNNICLHIIRAVISNLVIFNVNRTKLYYESFIYIHICEVSEKKREKRKREKERGFKIISQINFIYAIKYYQILYPNSYLVFSSLSNSLYIVRNENVTVFIRSERLDLEHKLLSTISQFLSFTCFLFLL